MKEVGVNGDLLGTVAYETSGDCDSDCFVQLDHGTCVLGVKNLKRSRLALHVLDTNEYEFHKEDAMSTPLPPGENRVFMCRSVTSSGEQLMVLSISGEDSGEVRAIRLVTGEVLWKLNRSTPALGQQFTPWGVASNSTTSICVLDTQTSLATAEKQTCGERLLLLASDGTVQQTLATHAQHAIRFPTRVGWCAQSPWHCIVIQHHNDDSFLCDVTVLDVQDHI